MDLLIEQAILCAAAFVGITAFMIWFYSLGRGYGKL